MMQNKNLIITGIVALVVGLGVGYFGAHVFAASAKTPSEARGAFAATGTGGFTRAGGATTAGGLLMGTVASVGSGSITLNTRDGSSHVVLTTPSTTVSKSVTGSLSDIAVGSTVEVTGTTNSDGSVSATVIQLRPAGSFSTTTSGTMP
jgi:hypothetical protein